MDHPCQDPANRLIAAYMDAHRELGLRGAIESATVLSGGIDMDWKDDQAGRFTMTDEAGNLLVFLDLSGWIAASKRQLSDPR
jgi:hypothetical protein